MKIIPFIFIFNIIICGKSTTTKPPSTPSKPPSTPSKPPSTPSKPPQTNSPQKATIKIAEKNKTLSFRTNGEFYVFNLKYKTSRKSFIKLLVIFISTLLFLSLMYSCFKVPLASGYNKRHCQRTKYFVKAFFFLLFLPCTIAYLLMIGLFGFLDGIFPENNFSNNVIQDEKGNLKSNKKKKKYNNIEPEMSETKKL